MIKNHCPGVVTPMSPISSPEETLPERKREKLIGSHLLSSEEAVGSERQAKLLALNRLQQLLMTGISLGAWATVVTSLSIENHLEHKVHKLTSPRPPSSIPLALFCSSDLVRALLLRGYLSSGPIRVGTSDKLVIKV